MESRVENHSRLRTSQANRRLGLGNPIQGPGVAEEVRAGADQSCCASESAGVQPAGGQALEEARGVDVRGEGDLGVDGVYGGEVTLGLGDGVVEEVHGVGGVGGLALCFDGTAHFGFLLGGDVDGELAEWVELLRDGVGHGEPLAFVAVVGGPDRRRRGRLGGLGVCWLGRRDLGRCGLSGAVVLPWALHVAVVLRRRP